MKINVLFKKVLENFNRLFVVGLCLLAFVSGWLVSGLEAQAGIFDSDDSYQEEKIYEKVDSDIQNRGQGNNLELDKTAEKIKNQLGRNLDNTQDTLDDAGYQIQKNYQRATNEAEATKNKIQGGAQQELGKAQSTANKTGNSIQDAAEEAIDAVKDLFN